MSHILETERLRLREFTLHDTAFVLELLNSPGWLQFIGDRNVKTKAQAKSYLKNGPLKSYCENGFGLWLVEKKDDSKAIGMCGILKRDTLKNPDIGFAFLPGFDGKGYAYESATATMAYANNKLKLPSIAAITIAENERSIRLLEKIGMACTGTVRLADDQDELLLYCN
ncbi:RimJ/RimL family protein N-acetyltransferase [Pontibacter aydingkolensis]|uniref:GNAT family N-acetyltransferase n=1 Tax=Pontibacter aydingkolensis TaxID=1911536 RepID=A0ABS7CNS7_9BACT|nr:GNAT family N-acetyltransferase [Pontibacter aydingkolensis]MBW7465491.1 GNAT family N-acetyltransferase [Pontibacter aydingkolensis]